MALQFVLGSSGSGKTEYIYERLVRQAGEHPKKNYLVIVPEQFTMQTQQKLVELAPNHAIMNIDVLSFKRLAYRVFDDMGMQDIQVLEETGKNLVLRRLAQEQEETLTVLRANMNRMGYIGEVKSMISELVQYRISPEQLVDLTEDKTISPVLSAKLRDVATMYRAFCDFMKDSFVTAEEILNVLKNLVPQSETLRDAVLVFDEFTGFTPIQNDLMRELLQVTEHIYITLTIDAAEDFYHCSGNEELFALSKKTILSLMKMAEELHVQVMEPVVMTDSAHKRFKLAPALAFMEQNLFRPRPAKYTKPVEEIHLAAVKNPQEELILVARQINALIRQGYRYREIAVVTGAVEAYQSYMDPVFTKYEIPYFMDTTKEVLFHPFIECIRAALEIVDTNFSYEAVMRFLRCGFCDIAEDDLDRLDSYLVATGIRGKAAWSRRWGHMPRQKTLYDLEQLEKLREKIYGYLEPFAAVFARKDARVSDGIRALYELLTQLDTQHQLWNREQQLLAQGEETRSREYAQIYTIVMQLLEKYNLLLGEEPLQIRDFTEVLEAGLSAADVAVIPPGYDSVTIGDIERTRLNHIRILFFIGVNDGIIPKAANAGGIISEYERELLAEKVELAPGVLFHVKGNRFGDFYLMVFYIGNSSVLFDGSKRIQMSFQTVLGKLVSDDRVVIPEDEGVVRCLVLCNAEFGINVILHTVVVAVQMIRCDIHQYGDVRTEVIHIVQLERTQFDDIIVMMIFGYLQSKALADVACQTYIQTCTLENMVNQGSGGRFSVRTGDTNHFGISIASGKLNF